MTIHSAIILNGWTVLNKWELQSVLGVLFITIWTLGTQFVIMPSCSILGSHDCHLQLPCQFSKKINGVARGKGSCTSLRVHCTSLRVYAHTPLCTLPESSQILNPSLTHSPTWKKPPQAKLHTHTYPLPSRSSPLTCLPACLLITWDMQIPAGFPTDFACGSQWEVTRRSLPNKCYDSVHYGKEDSRDCHCLGDMTPLHDTFYHCQSQFLPS